MVNSGFRYFIIRLFTHSDDVDERCLARVLQSDQRQFHLFLPEETFEPVQNPINYRQHIDCVCAVRLWWPPSMTFQFFFISFKSPSVAGRFVRVFYSIVCSAKHVISALRTRHTQRLTHAIIDEIQKCFFSSRFFSLWQPIVNTKHLIDEAILRDNDELKKTN